MIRPDDFQDYENHELTTRYNDVAEGEGSPDEFNAIERAVAQRFHSYLGDPEVTYMVMGDVYTPSGRQTKTLSRVTLDVSEQPSAKDAKVAAARRALRKTQYNENDVEPNSITVSEVVDDTNISNGELVD